MRISIGLLATCCLLLGAALAGPAAGAQPGGKTEVQHPRTGVGVILDGGRGQILSLSFPTPKLALLNVLRLRSVEGELSLATASYAVRGRSRPAHGVLRADFGPVGEISVRFRPKGEPSKTNRPRNCSGPRPTIEFGRVRGRIALEGEGGYFRVGSDRGLAIRERSFRLVCRRGWAANIPANVNLRQLVAPEFLPFSFLDSGAIAVLNAVAKVEGRFVSLRASHQMGAPPGAEIQVSSLESGNGMAVGRSLFLNGGKGTLRTSLPGAHPATATFAPPPPLYGQGDFLETSSRSHSWTGSLGVRLPGLKVPLTGPRFHTSLCVLSPLKSPGGCDAAKPKPLLPAHLALMPALERLRDR